MKNTVQQFKYVDYLWDEKKAAAGMKRKLQP